MQHIHNLQVLKARRRELRKNQTPEEEKLWWYLKEKKLGYKFRRQHSAGGYILDFYCKEKKLIVEIDGGIHQNYGSKEYDRVRDKYFTDLEYRVLRFSNLEVEKNIEMVITKINSCL